MYSDEKKNRRNYLLKIIKKIYGLNSFITMRIMKMSVITKVVNTITN